MSILLLTVVLEWILSETGAVKTDLEEDRVDARLAMPSAAWPSMPAPGAGNPSLKRPSPADEASSASGSRAKAKAKGGGVCFAFTRGKCDPKTKNFCHGIL